MDKNFKAVVEMDYHQVELRIFSRLTSTWYQRLWWKLKYRLGLLRFNHIYNRRAK